MRSRAAEAREPGTRPPISTATYPPAAASAASSVLAAIIVAGLLTIIISRMLALPPVFDGAMNLQVAWNLAEGNSYQRTYAERTIFPREVQTNGPFVLVAALAYRVFGMGVVQSQLANVVFLLLLVGAAGWIGRSVRGRLGDGILAVALFVSTPGLLRYCLGGYGEVPSLALALAGLAVYPWGTTAARARVLLAAALLGAAVITKTVMLVCVVPFAAVMLLHAVTRPLPPAARAGRVALLAAGFLAPIAAWEAYRMVALGGLEAYRAWWGLESASISKEAGVKGGAAAAVLDKLRQHFVLLAKFLQLPRPLAAAWLLLPFVVATCVSRRAGVARWILLALLAASIAYFAWWLGLTPTPKAWHRRIFNGMVLLNITWVVAGSALLAGPVVTAWRRRLGIAVMFAAGAFATTFLFQSRIHGALQPVAVDHVYRAVELLRALPEDAPLFAAGWSSAPQISLLADRPLLDVNDIPHEALAAASPAYLIVDQESGHSSNITTMYPSTPLIAGNTLPQIYRFDARVLAAEPELADLSERTALGELEDGQAVGFHKRESSGRWASADVAVRAVYRGEETLAIEAYVLPPTRYDAGRPPNLSIQLDGCRLPPVQTKSGLGVIEVPLAPCAPQPGQEVTVRISSDALIQSSLTKDARAMAFIAKSIELKDHPQ